MYALEPGSIGASVEEVAEWLSAAEGREVTVQEVYRIEAQAMRKVLRALLARGITLRDLLPGK
ncbi:MAG TPA: hypothetical protein VJ654_20335 [Noviherbaspirillum sp.]|nr:hypothetical protein [Noviherbaspirillum sp.]